MDKIQTWPFWTGATHPYPVLDHPQSLLPIAGNLLQPKVMEETEGKLEERKRKQALVFNKGTKELPELQPGDTVRVKPLPTDNEKLWRKGSVVKQVEPRSYEVDLQGTVFRRNSRHLVKTKEPSPQLDLESQANLPSSSTPLPMEGPPVMQTRSCRVIRRPGPSCSKADKRLTRVSLSCVQKHFLG